MRVWASRGINSFQVTKIPSSPTASASRLEGLPCEIKILILQNLPDIPSLQNLCLSSKDLHEAYFNNRKRVLADVLELDIGGPANAQDALFAAQASQLQMGPYNHVETVEEFEANWDGSKCAEINLRTLDLKNLAEISQLRKDVRSFASKYYQNKLNISSSMTDTKRKATMPTSNEFRRIYRAI